MRKVVVLLGTIAAASAFAQQQVKPVVPVVKPVAPVVKPGPMVKPKPRLPSNIVLALPSIESVQRAGQSPGPAADSVLLGGEAIRVHGRNLGAQDAGYGLMLELNGQRMPILVNPNVPWTSDTIGAYVPALNAIRDAGLPMASRGDQYKVVLVDPQGRPVARKPVALRFLGNRQTQDFDGDGQNAESGDCDDFDANRWSGWIEVCDREGKDEDCDPLTYGERDADGDHFFDAKCFNLDDAGNRTSGGNDCNDNEVTANPIRPENCPAGR